MLTKIRIKKHHISEILCRYNTCYFSNFRPRLLSQRPFVECKDKENRRQSTSPVCFEPISIPTRTGRRYAWNSFTMLFIGSYTGSVCHDSPDEVLLVNAREQMRHWSVRKNSDVIAAVRFRREVNSTLLLVIIIS